MLRLDGASLDWALQHAIKYGDTDIFPQPFEYTALRRHWDSLRDYLLQQDIERWVARPCRRCLTPKHRYGFRISTQLDPLDFLVYAALVFEIGEDIETRRVPRDSCCVFSYRFGPDQDGRLFSASPDNSAFQKRSRELLDNGSYAHVVTADIADFYPRLYAHRLENALNASTRRSGHVKAIKNLLGQWNEHYSYGIPVGPAPSRLLAEAAIDDVDKALLSEGAVLVRFNDDYRIFCRSDVEAHRMLSFLANVLFENHGLTLQQHKTKILPLDHFRRDRFLSAEETELGRLSEKFYEIVNESGLDNVSGYIDYDSLEADQQAKIDSLNLEGLLEEQLRHDELDISLTKFVLRRLAQLDNSAAVDSVFGSIEKLYPVVSDVAQYLMRMRTMSTSDKSRIGDRIIGLLSAPNDNIVTHLEFHRMWLLHLFGLSADWGSSSRLAQLMPVLPDEFSQRKLMLALGRSNADYWFRTGKRNVFSYGPWQRRAFLQGGWCLPAEEKRHWYRSLEPRLDPLERAIVS